MMKLKTTLCDVLGIQYPIIQAGMGWDKQGSTTPAALVAAVSNAGGLGVVGGSPMQPDLIRERIKQTRDLTDRPFGVDITLPRLSEVPSDVPPSDTRMVRRFIEDAHPEHMGFVRKMVQDLGLELQEPDARSWIKTPELVRRQLDVILEERVQVLAIGLGDTREVVPLAHAQGMKVLALAGNVRHAVRHARNGVDVIVAQGYEAGGHTGNIANFALIPQVVDAVRPTPVVAAGGIADGRGLAAALSLGAVGVWCGTVFLISQESAIHSDYRNQIVTGSTEDFILGRYCSGKPSRHFRSAYIQAWEKSGLRALDMPYQGVLTDEVRLAAEAANRVGVMSVPGGQIAGLLGEKHVRPAREILESMMSEAAQILKDMAGRYVL
ncbi:MAG: nitronate monooxygenase [Deltaproteobacteria bacterium]|nr:nitronate monooxygenase [Deltaproteobacteria bacterium]